MNLRLIGGAILAAATLVTPVAAHASGTTVCNSPVSRNTTGQPHADTVVGACVAGGGYVEIGVGQAGNNAKFYVVSSSDQFGYVGLSNFESGAYTTCTPGGHDVSEGGSGTNSGGCYGVDGVAAPVNLRSIVGNDVPLPVCGDGTGPWYDSTRDGCRADAGDVTDSLNALLGTVACVEANLTTPAALPACL